jgi:hypothetical protein
MYETLLTRLLETRGDGVGNVEIAMMQAPVLEFRASPVGSRLQIGLVLIRMVACYPQDNLRPHWILVQHPSAEPEGTPQI